MIRYQLCTYWDGFHFKKINITTVGMDVEKLELSYIAGEMQTDAITLGNSLVGLQKVTHRAILWPSNSAPR